MSLHEECGIFGVIASEICDVASISYYGLYALQHRGQESCGIVVNDDGVFVSHKDMGLVSEVFSQDILTRLPNGIRTRIRHKPSEGSEEVLDSIRAGYVSYVINTRAILSGKHFGDGIAIRQCAAQNNITMLTSLDTVRMLLDVLEEVTLGISTIDARG